MTDENAGDKSCTTLLDTRIEALAVATRKKRLVDEPYKRKWRLVQGVTVRAWASNRLWAIGKRSAAASTIAFSAIY